ncbi:GSCFA domain-containing protein [Flavobacteriaceae bacterium F08102]|nr:GSCFA domain-containing protein [Flavobacteriaceae bacterium F08102]
MELQTKIPRYPAKNRLTYLSKTVCLGSCFAVNIGEKLSYYKFQNTLNPTGILFHPKAIETFIQRSVEENFYQAHEFFFDRNLWHHFELHSSLSHPDKESILATANNRLLETKSALKTATHIFITLGTAWVYEHKESKKIVANCHKIKQSSFKKTLLSINQISESLEQIKNHIYAVNKNAQLIFTLSPVRHLKDGFIENQRSKAHLLCAIHTFLDKYKEAGYFAGYELVLDELRDYRFYKEDMIHPSPLAINYIWEAFKAIWIEESAYITMRKVKEIQQNLAHRPFQVDSVEHRQFLKKTEEKIKQIQAEYNFIQF